jgi:Mg2+/Co2+ transporter CorC
LPGFAGDIDHIKGILLAKDLLVFWQQPETTWDLGRVLRPAYFIPESKKISDLLRDLVERKTQIAIVIDEYGGTAGLVTLEDLIEELVGAIVDEYDTESAEAVELGDGTYRVSAKMSIDDLGELFDLELDDDEVDTVGGLLAKALGRVPIVGSTVTVDGVTLRADRLEGRRNRVSHVIAAAAPKEDTDLGELLDEADTMQQGVPREQAE